MAAVLDYLSTPLKRGVTQILQSYLQRYIKNISLGELGVLGRDFILEDLELRLDALQDLIPTPLSFVFTRGFVKTLRISIPWTHLLSQPIEIKLHTLECVLTARSRESYAKTVKRLAAAPAVTPGGAGAAAGGPTKRDDAGAAGSATAAADAAVLPAWLQDKVTQILANVTLHIDNVVFKYIHAGVQLVVTVRSVKIFSADPDAGWNRAFQPVDDARKTLHKVVSVQGLTITLEQLRPSAMSFDSFSTGHTPLPLPRVHEYPILSRTSAEARIRLCLDPTAQSFLDAANAAATAAATPASAIVEQLHFDREITPVTRTPSSGAGAPSHDVFGSASHVVCTAVDAGPDAPGSRRVVVASFVDVEIPVLDFSISERQCVLLQQLTSLPEDDPAHEAALPEEPPETPALTSASANQKTEPAKEGWMSWAWNVVVGEVEQEDADDDATPAIVAPTVDSVTVLAASIGRITCTMLRHPDCELPDDASESSVTPSLTTPVLMQVPVHNLGLVTVDASPDVSKSKHLQTAPLVICSVCVYGVCAEARLWAGVPEPCKTLMPWSSGATPVQWLDLFADVDAVVVHAPTVPTTVDHQLHHPIVVIGRYVEHEPGNARTHLCSRAGAPHPHHLNCLFAATSVVQRNQFRYADLAQSSSLSARSLGLLGDHVAHDTNAPQAARVFISFPIVAAPTAQPAPGAGGALTLPSPPLAAAASGPPSARRSSTRSSARDEDSDSVGSTGSTASALGFDGLLPFKIDVSIGDIAVLGNDAPIQSILQFTNNAQLVPLIHQLTAPTALPTVQSMEWDAAAAAVTAMDMATGKQKLPEVYSVSVHASCRVVSVWRESTSCTVGFLVQSIDTSLSKHAGASQETLLTIAECVGLRFAHPTGSSTGWLRVQSLNCGWTISPSLRSAMSCHSNLPVLQRVAQSAPHAAKATVALVHVQLASLTAHLSPDDWRWLGELTPMTASATSSRLHLSVSLQQLAAHTSMAGGSAVTTGLSLKHLTVCTHTDQVERPVLQLGTAGNQVFGIDLQLCVFGLPHILTEATMAGLCGGHDYVTNDTPDLPGVYCKIALQPWLVDTTSLQELPQFQAPASAPDPDAQIAVDVLVDENGTQLLPSTALRDWAHALLLPVRTSNADPFGSVFVAVTVEQGRVLLPHQLAVALSRVVITPVRIQDALPLPGATAAAFGCQLAVDGLFFGLQDSADGLTTSLQCTVAMHRMLELGQWTSGHIPASEDVHPTLRLACTLPTVVAQVSPQLVRSIMVWLSQVAAVARAPASTGAVADHVTSPPMTLALDLTVSMPSFHLQLLNSSAASLRLAVADVSTRLQQFASSSTITLRLGTVQSAYCVESTAAPPQVWPIASQRAWNAMSPLVQMDLRANESTLHMTCAIASIMAVIPPELIDLFAQYMPALAVYEAPTSSAVAPVSGGSSSSSSFNISATLDGCDLFLPVSLLEFSAVAGTGPWLALPSDTTWRELPPCVVGSMTSLRFHGTEVDLQASVSISTHVDAHFEWPLPFERVDSAAAMLRSPGSLLSIMRPVAVSFAYSQDTGIVGSADTVHVEASPQVALSCVRVSKRLAQALWNLVSAIPLKPATARAVQATPTPTTHQTAPKVDVHIPTIDVHVSNDASYQLGHVAVRGVRYSSSPVGSGVSAKVAVSHCQVLVSAESVPLLVIGHEDVAAVECGISITDGSSNLSIQVGSGTVHVPARQLGPFCEFLGKWQFDLEPDTTSGPGSTTQASSTPDTADGQRSIDAWTQTIKVIVDPWDIEWVSGRSDCPSVLVKSSSAYFGLLATVKGVKTIDTAVTGLSVWWRLEDAHSAQLPLVLPFNSRFNASRHQAGTDMEVEVGMINVHAHAAACKWLVALLQDVQAATVAITPSSSATTPVDKHMEPAIIRHVRQPSDPTMNLLPLSALRRKWLEQSQDWEPQAGELTLRSVAYRGTDNVWRVPIYWRWKSAVVVTNVRSLAPLSVPVAQLFSDDAMPVHINDPSVQIPSHIHCTLARWDSLQKKFCPVLSWNLALHCFDRFSQAPRTEFDPQGVCDVQWLAASQPSAVWRLEWAAPDTFELNRLAASHASASHEGFLGISAAIVTCLGVDSRLPSSSVNTTTLHLRAAGMSLLTSLCAPASSIPNLPTVRLYANGAQLWMGWWSPLHSSSEQVWPALPMFRVFFALTDVGVNVVSFIDAHEAALLEPMNATVDMVMNQPSHSLAAKDISVSVGNIRVNVHPRVLSSVIRTARSFVDALSGDQEAPLTVACLSCLIRNHCPRRLWFGQYSTAQILAVDAGAQASFFLDRPMAVSSAGELRLALDQDSGEQCAVWGAPVPLTTSGCWSRGLQQPGGSGNTVVIVRVEHDGVRPIVTIQGNLCVFNHAAVSVKVSVKTSVHVQSVAESPHEAAGGLFFKAPVSASASPPAIVVSEMLDLHLAAGTLSEPSISSTSWADTGSRKSVHLQFSLPDQPASPWVDVTPLFEGQAKSDWFAVAAISASQWVRVSGTFSAASEDIIVPQVVLDLFPIVRVHNWLPIPVCLRLHQLGGWDNAVPTEDLRQQLAAARLAQKVHALVAETKHEDADSMLLLPPTASMDVLINPKECWRLELAQPTEGSWPQSMAEQLSSLCSYLPRGILPALYVSFGGGEGGSSEAVQNCLVPANGDQLVAAVWQRSETVEVHFRPWLVLRNECLFQLHVRIAESGSQPCVVDVNESWSCIAMPPTGVPQLELAVTRGKWGTPVPLSVGLVCETIVGTADPAFCHAVVVNVQPNEYGCLQVTCTPRFMIRNVTDVPLQCCFQSAVLAEHHLDGRPDIHAPYCDLEAGVLLQPQLHRSVAVNPPKAAVAPARGWFWQTAPTAAPTPTETTAQSLQCVFRVSMQVQADPSSVEWSLPIAVTMNDGATRCWSLPALQVDRRVVATGSAGTYRIVIPSRVGTLSYLVAHVSIQGHAMRVDISREPRPALTLVNHSVTPVFVEVRQSPNVASGAAAITGIPAKHSMDIDAAAVSVFNLCKQEQTNLNMTRVSSHDSVFESADRVPAALAFTLNPPFDEDIEGVWSPAVWLVPGVTSVELPVDAEDHDVWQKHRVTIRHTAGQCIVYWEPHDGRPDESPVEEEPLGTPLRLAVSVQSLLIRLAGGVTCQREELDEEQRLWSMPAMLQLAMFDVQVQVSHRIVFSLPSIPFAEWKHDVIIGGLQLDNHHPSSASFMPVLLQLPTGKQSGVAALRISIGTAEQIEDLHMLEDMDDRLHTSHEIGARFSRFVRNCSVQVGPAWVHASDSLIQYVASAVADVVACAQVGWGPVSGDSGNAVTVAPMPAASWVIESLKISEIDVLLTLQASPAVYVSVQQMPLRLSAVALKGVHNTLERLGRELIANYIADALLRSPALVGSLDLIGNPTLLLRSFRDGLVTLVATPLASVQAGMAPSEVARSVLTGWAGLVRSVSEGALLSVGGFASAISRNLDRLSAVPGQAPVNVDGGNPAAGGGLQTGIAALSRRVVGAAAGIVMTPLGYGTSSGWSLWSVAAGVGAGLLGVVTQPVSGALDFVAHSSSGLLQATGLHEALPRSHWPAGFWVHPSTVLKLSVLNESVVLFSASCTILEPAPLQSGCTLGITMDAVVLFDHMFNVCQEWHRKRGINMESHGSSIAITRRLSSTSEGLWVLDLDGGAEVAEAVSLLLSDGRRRAPTVDVDGVEETKDVV